MQATEPNRSIARAGRRSRIDRSVWVVVCGGCWCQAVAFNRDKLPPLFLFVLFSARFVPFPRALFFFARAACHSPGDQPYLALRCLALPHMGATYS